MNKYKKYFMILLTIFTGLLFSSCSNEKVTIKGAGASFPFPLYSQIFDQYYEKTKIKIDYEPIGSGGGVKEIKGQTIDFGATDVHIDDEKVLEINQSTANEILQIPTVLGGIAITYNLPIEQEIKFDGRLLADIFMGKIKRWNDPRIAFLNDGVALPDSDIIVVRRSDDSGTTHVLSSYLAKKSSEWKTTMGVGKSLQWFDRSLGAGGSEGAIAVIENTHNSIGYVSLNYAIKNNLPVVAIENIFKEFIKPTINSVSLAANDPRTVILNVFLFEEEKNTYPISTFTWLVFYKEQSYKNRSKKQAKELQEILYWIIDEEAQSEAKSLLYAPLPHRVVENARKTIASMTYKGELLD